MTERAAHLVDHVIPDVPVRQWVLTLPHRIRYLLAWRHDLCKVVVRVLLRECAAICAPVPGSGLRDVRESHELSLTPAGGPPRRSGAVLEAQRQPEAENESNDVFHKVSSGPGGGRAFAIG